MFTESEYRIAQNEAARLGRPALAFTSAEFREVEQATVASPIPSSTPAYFRARVLERRAEKLGFKIVAPVVRAAAAVTSRPAAVAPQSEEQTRFNALLGLFS
jgi:hypothetical protein